MKPSFLSAIKIIAIVLFATIFCSHLAHAANTTKITAQQRMAQLTQIQNLLNGLPGTNEANDTQAVVKAFKNSPKVWKNVGVSGGSVYAQWADGPMIIVNVVPAISLGGGTPLPTATPKPTATPTGQATPGPTPKPTATPTAKPGATATPTATSQPSAGYTVSGKITMSDGTSPAGITMLVAKVGDVMNPPQSADTLADGSWSVSNVKSGDYQVSGFKVFYDITPAVRFVTVGNKNLAVGSFSFSPSAIQPPTLRSENRTSVEYMPTPTNTAETVEDAAVSLAKSAAAADPQLPAAKQVRILCTFPDTGTYSDKLRQVITEARFGYTSASKDATVDGLKHVQGDGVFYMDAHAGLAAVNGVPTCFVQTATPVSLNTLGDPVKSADLDSLRLVAMISKEEIRDANNNLIRKAIYSNYGFGPSFIKYYKWSFAHNSFVWINACYAANTPLRNALFTAGASLVGGWTKSVRNMRSLDAGHWLIDRLLGANELRGMSGSFGPETIAQRAFPLSALIPVLAKKKLDYDSTDDGEAHLQFVSNAAKGNFGLLAPSIEYMDVNEYKNQLILTGSFGDRPADGGQVALDGKAATGVQWTPSQITCTIPAATQPHSCGAVLAIADKRSSNESPLSMWQGFFEYDLDDLQDCAQQISLQLRFRGDIHPYRMAPGDTPVRPGPVLFYPTQDSSTKGSWKASGQAKETQVISPQVTITKSQTWSGSGLLSQSDPQHNIMMYNAQLDMTTRTLQFGLSVRNAKYHVSFFSEATNTGSQSSEADAFMQIDPKATGNALGIMQFKLSAQTWSAQGGGTGWKSTPSTIQLISVSPPAREQIEWPDGLQCASPPPFITREFQGS